MLVHLDPNYASRIAEHLRAQPAHEASGTVIEALRQVRPLVPPGPFHALETRGG